MLWHESGKNGIEQLRAGTGAFICLADDPSDDQRRSGSVDSRLICQSCQHLPIRR
ncbi:MAG: hypothetical protein ACT4O1_03530 [Gemmatimonadota bacterium]